METRIDDFTAFGLRPELLKGIADLGFAKPTPIQRDAIPPASPAATSWPAR